jgi:hypothetical protein
VPRASAQTAAAGGSADAQELFKQGRAALEAKDYATACPKFSASLQLERAVGTLISLAECEDATMRLAGARQHWQEAADLADATSDRLNRGSFARQRFTQVDLRVPRLVLRLAAGAPKDTEVQRDGVTLGTAALGVALPVDVGAHSIQVTAPDHASAHIDVVLAEGERRVVEVEPGPASAPATIARGVEPPPPVMAPAPPAPDAPSSQSAQRTISYVVGGAGIVGLGVGSYFGLQTISRWSTAQRDCANGCADGSAGRNERNEAQTDGTVSTIAFVAGGLAAAAGAVLFFTAPRPHPDGSGARVHVTPTADRTGAGLRLLGTW